jgi:hypothetical protein
MPRSRHTGPHTFAAGEEVTVISGGVHRVNYPGVVDRVTPSQVHVTYDASRTSGRPAIKKVFWGATGYQVGGFSGSAFLRKRQPEDTFV